MDANFLGLGNILETLGLNTTKAFELYYETALEGRETLDLNIDGFEWAEPQLDFTYEALEAQGYIKAMATYVDLNSEPLARGKHVEMSKLSGTIPRQKRKINRGENDYRKEVLAAQQAGTIKEIQGGTYAGGIRGYLINNLFDTLSEIPDSHNASLSYQVGQMKSKRALTLTSDNNFNGLTDVDFTADVPAANVVDEAWYTVADDGTVTYITTANPIETLVKKIRGIKRDRYRGYPNVTVEVQGETLDTVLLHPNVLKGFGYSLNSNLRIVPKNDENATTLGTQRYYEAGGYEALKEYFRAAIGADVLLVNDTIVGAAKLNATTKRFDTETLDVFEPGVILIRPSGVIGKIFNVVPLRPDGSAISSRIFDGRGIIEYFYNPRTREQTWISELTMLAVPTMPSKMYYYNVIGTATNDDDDTGDGEN